MFGYHGKHTCILNYLFPFYFRWIEKMLQIFLIVFILRFWRIMIRDNLKHFTSGFVSRSDSKSQDYILHSTKIWAESLIEENDWRGAWPSRRVLINLSFNHALASNYGGLSASSQHRNLIEIQLRMSFDQNDWLSRPGVSNHLAYTGQIWRKKNVSDSG